MAPQSNPSDREAILRKQKKGPAFKLLVPLVYAPILPLIRISLRKNPVMSQRLFTIALAGAFAHGVYLVSAYIMICIDNHFLKATFLCGVISGILDQERTEAKGVKVMREILKSTGIW